MGWFGHLLKSIAKPALALAGTALGGPIGGFIGNALGNAAGISSSDKQSSNASAIEAEANPFGPYRPMYGAQLAKLMADPSSFSTDPGYQFILNQGLDNTTRKLASQGYAGSGMMATELAKFAEGTAATYRGQELDRLAGLAGANIMPASRASATQAQASSFDQMSSVLASMGYGNTRQAAPATPTAPTAPQLAYPNVTWGDAPSLPDYPNAYAGG